MIWTQKLELFRKGIQHFKNNISRTQTQVPWGSWVVVQFCLCNPFSLYFSRTICISLCCLLLRAGDWLSVNCQSVSIDISCLPLDMRFSAMLPCPSLGVFSQQDRRSQSSQALFWLSLSLHYCLCPWTRIFLWTTPHSHAFSDILLLQTRYLSFVTFDWFCSHVALYLIYCTYMFASRFVSLPVSLHAGPVVCCSYMKMLKIKKDFDQNTVKGETVICYLLNVNIIKLLNSPIMKCQCLFLKL